MKKYLQSDHVLEDFFVTWDYPNHVLVIKIFILWLACDWYSEYLIFWL